MTISDSGHGNAKRRLGQLRLRGHEEDHETEDLGEDERIADGVPSGNIVASCWAATMPCMLRVLAGIMTPTMASTIGSSSSVGDELAPPLWRPPMSEYLLAEAQPAMRMPITDRDDRPHGKEDACVEVGEVHVGAERHHHEDQEGRSDDDVGRQREEPPVGVLGCDVLDREMRRRARAS